MKHELRDMRVAKAVAGAPESAKNLLTRAFSGSASPRQAIKAQCLACLGYDREAIRNCTGYTCPLWKYRPFQANEALESALEKLLTR